MQSLVLLETKHFHACLEENMLVSILVLPSAIRSIFEAKRSILGYSYTYLSTDLIKFFIDLITNYDKP